MYTKDEMKIVGFINVIYGSVVAYTKELIESIGVSVEKEEGQGVDLTLFLTSDDNRTKAQLRLENLFLEIVSIDRDESSLRFDNNLCDIEYLSDKVTRVVQSRIEVIECSFNVSDKSKFKKNMQELYDKGGYERISYEVDDTRKSNN